MLEVTKVTDFIHILYLILRHTSVFACRRLILDAATGRSGLVRVPVNYVATQ
jgi:hypothetical protein